MRDKRQNVLRSVTLLLMICMSNLFVFAGIPAASGSNPAVSGTLSVFDQDSAFVNGNVAQDGATVLSGSEIKTDKSGARINLNGMGTIDLAAGTSGYLTFTSGQINLNISLGQAELTSLNGVTGVLTTPEGEVLKTDPTLASSTVANTAAANASSKPWTKNQKIAAGVVIAIAILIPVIIIASREGSPNR